MLGLNSRGSIGYSVVVLSDRVVCRNCS